MSVSGRTESASFALIEQTLGNFRRIAQDRVAAGDRHCEAIAGRLNRGAFCLGRLVNQSGKIATDKLGLFLGDRRQAQHAVDHAAQAMRGRDNSLAVRGVFGPIAAFCTLDQHFAIADDGVERGSEFVA